MVFCIDLEQRSFRSLRWSHSIRALLFCPHFRLGEFRRTLDPLIDVRSALVVRRIMTRRCRNSLRFTTRSPRLHHEHLFLNGCKMPNPMRMMLLSRKYVVILTRILILNYRERERETYILFNILLVIGAYLEAENSRVAE